MPDQHDDTRTAMAAALGPLRLRLNPNVPATSYVDGAWWPRSRQLTAELPGLLAELTASVRLVALVGYHRNAWDAAPEQMDVAGRTVGLEGFSSSSPATVLVIGAAGERVTLLVVAPETAEDQAQQMLAAAGQPGDALAGVGPGKEAEKAEARSLDELATRLARVDGRTDPQRTALITGWVAEAAEQFTHARVQAFVPILVEHIVRGRLRAAGKNPEPIAGGRLRSRDLTAS